MFNIFCECFWLRKKLRHYLGGFFGLIKNWLINRWENRQALLRRSPDMQKFWERQ